MKFVVLFLTLGLCCLRQTSGVTHSLKYFYTASSGISTFPEFVVVGLMDDVQFFHFDSDSQQAVAKQDWLNKLAEANPQYFQRENQNLQGTIPVYKNNIDVAKQRFNQTGGVHTFQNMYGCQLDDVSGSVDGYYQFGYDGEDFISLDLKSQQWIATKPEARITKQKWDSEKPRLEYLKNYFTKECADWIKKYVTYGTSVLARQVSPKVSLFQRDTSLPVAVCHATGFYPEGIMITWKKDGEEIQEDIDVGETLPNEDGTFQKRSVLTVSPEEWKKSKYTCEVATKSGSFKPDESEESSSAGLIAGVVVGVLMLFILITAVVLWWKNRKPDSGFVPANTKDDGSTSSDEIPRKV